MKIHIALVIPLILVCSVGGSNAQTLPESGRAPVPSNIIDPVFAAKGMPFGAFRLYPALVVGVATDDNVFRVENGAESDAYFTISPRLSLETQSEGHFVAGPAVFSWLRGISLAPSSRMASSNDQTRPAWRID